MAGKEKASKENSGMKIASKEITIYEIKVSGPTDSPFSQVKPSSKIHSSVCLSIQ